MMPSKARFSTQMKYKICKSSFSKMRGLMFSRKKNLIFVFGSPRKISLHMFFVFFPIDVLFLDENKRVIEIKRDFMPFTFCRSKKEAGYAVELAKKEDRGRFCLGKTVKF